MINYNVRFGDLDYYRINRKTARKLYNLGFHIVITPCKLNPANKWACYSWLAKCDAFGEKDDFEKLCNAFEFYNCNHECGYYAAFYFPKLDGLHFAFKDGSNPYLYFGKSGFLSDDELRQKHIINHLAKWSKNWRCVETGYRQCVVDHKLIAHFSLEEKRKTNY